MLKRLFTEHPASVNESYFEHVGVALGFGFKMFYGAVVCLVHAFLPFLFVKTGSQVITGLHNQMVANRNRSGTNPNADASNGITA